MCPIGRRLLDALTATRAAATATPTAPCGNGRAVPPDGQPRPVSMTQKRLPSVSARMTKSASSG